MTGDKLTRGGRRPGAGRKPKQEQQDDIARYNKAKADKERALADLRTMEAATQARELIPVAEVEAAYSQSNARVAQMLLGLPDQFERAVGMSPEACALLETLIHGAMESLADDLARLTGPEERAE